MARVEMDTAAPIIVAQRMCDLLQSFPAAAMGGVQWQTLARKYEERYSSQLDIQALGHSSPLAAATALLWEVLRIVEAVDTDNPVVAVEDSVALTPRPGLLASWPSMYQVFCELVLDRGGANEILLSQLKPLLQKHWHNSFDESGLSYLTEEGSSVKLKKMKHLVQGVLRWREQRSAWQTESGVRLTPLDSVLQPQLELVPSKKHNDLVLRIATTNARATEFCAKTPVKVPRPLPPQQHCDGTNNSDVQTDAESVHSSTSSDRSLELTQELESLRAQNAILRANNELLEHHVRHAALTAAGILDVSAGPLAVEEELFDNPFEPPPEARSHGSWGCGASPLGSSTAASGSFSHSSGSLTPWSQASHSRPESGSATPAFGAGGRVCAFVPLWFPMGDRGEIPSGMVQQVRAVFERGGGALPSFFAGQ